MKKIFLTLSLITATFTLFSCGEEADATAPACTPFQNASAQATGIVTQSCNNSYYLRMNTMQRVQLLHLKTGVSAASFLSQRVTLTFNDTGTTTPCNGNNIQAIDVRCIGRPN